MARPPAVQAFGMAPRAVPQIPTGTARLPGNARPSLAHPRFAPAPAIQRHGKGNAGSLPSSFHSGPLRYQGVVLQAKLLKNIDSIIVSGGDARPISGGMFDANFRPFFYGEIAAHPNKTMDELFAELDNDAYPNPTQMLRVTASKVAFWAWVDSVVGKDWGTVKREWKQQGQQLEKLYMDLKGNKVPVSGAPGTTAWAVSQGHSSEIDRADSGQAWRSRGVYGGIKSRIPNTYRHFAVGRHATEQKPGAERIFVQNLRLKDGGEGIRAFYSQTHGDSNALRATEEVLVSDKTIGGKRIVAPWDPYQR
jgi:hypothetical protein